MTQYNPTLKMLWFKVIQPIQTPLPRLVPSRVISNEWTDGSPGENQLINGFLPSLRQRLSDLLRGHEDPAQLSREVVRLHGQGLYANAVVAARRLVDLQRRRLGSRHADYASAISNRGHLLHQQGNIKEAEVLLSEALELRRDLLGESHPQFAIALLQMANVLQAKGDLDSAERLIRQAIDIQRNLLGPNDPELARSLTSHALLLTSRGDLVAAESLLRRALAIRKEHSGDRHPLYASALSNLALLLWRRGDRGAEELLRQSLAIRDEVLGPNHPDSVENREYLSMTLAKSPSHEPPVVHSSITPTDEIRDEPLLRLSDEYARISKELESASLLENNRRRSKLGELSRRSDRCHQDLVTMIGEHDNDILARVETEAEPVSRSAPVVVQKVEPRAHAEAAKTIDGPNPDRPLSEPVVPSPPLVLAPTATIQSPAALAPDPARLEALEVLDSMMKVKALKPGLSDLLESYRDKVKSLRESLVNSTERVTPDDLAVVQFSHSVSALARLACDKHLSNQEWLELYGDVAETLGYPLAPAASKGQIVFPGDTAARLRASWCTFLG